MEEVISSIYYLVLEISLYKGPEDEFSNWGSKIFNVRRLYGQDTIPQSEDKSQVLSKLANCLTEDLYETASSLYKSGIVFIHNKRNILISHRSSNKPQEILKNWLKKFSPINKLFSFIADDGILSLEGKISSLITEIHYNKAVSVQLNGSWDSYIFPKEWLAYDNVKRELLDSASIWIDTLSFNNVGKLEEIDVFELSIPDNLFGVEIGDYILPLSPVDKFIARDHFSDYFFLALTNVFSPDKPGNVDRPLEDAFLKTFKSGDLGKLLSFLNFNLYISERDMELKEDYSPFFEEVVGLEEIENLDAYQLYVSKPSNLTASSGKTIVGIYEKEKTGSEYNILNWITSTENGTISHIGDKVNQQKSNLVFVLRPPYCNYFSSKLFEDIFSSILHELECPFIPNAKLNYGRGGNVEVDSIIKVADGSFVYVENKTTLNRYNIEDTIEKIEKFHSFVSSEYPMLDFNYVIIAPYSNINIEEGYRYFINQSIKKTEKRDGVNCGIYDFCVPIAKFDNVSLRCIVEPEYERMKAIVNDIIK